jgi:3-hydroxyacyl-[acyl-carrier-protein] dehydratase
MLATRDTITRYIPQRPPMVMIHELIQTTVDSAETQVEVLPENIFVVNGLLREPGLVENIAQTAAAHMGYTYTSKGLPVPIGYIVNIKDLNVLRLPATGELLRTVIRVTNEVLNVIIVEGKVYGNGNVICQCEMRVFIEK